jgi:Arc/MetJ family transcription regulator
MKTTIVLNEELVAEAMKLSKAATKQEVIDMALQNFVAYLKRRNMKTLFGKVSWEGDLGKIRGM